MIISDEDELLKLSSSSDSSFLARFAATGVFFCDAAFRLATGAFFAFGAAFRLDFGG